MPPYNLDSGNPLALWVCRNNSSGPHLLKTTIAGSAATSAAMGRQRTEPPIFRALSSDFAGALPDHGRVCLALAY